MLAFLACFASKANVFYFCRQTVHIVLYPAMSKVQKMSNFIVKSRSKHRSYPFLGRLLSRLRYTVAVSFHWLYMNQVPGDCHVYTR